MATEDLNNNQQGNESVGEEQSTKPNWAQYQVRVTDANGEELAIEPCPFCEKNDDPHVRLITSKAPTVSLVNPHEGDTKVEVASGDYRRTARLKPGETLTISGDDLEGYQTSADAVGAIYRQVRIRLISLRNRNEEKERELRSAFEAATKAYAKQMGLSDHNTEYVVATTVRLFESTANSNPTDEISLSFYNELGLQMAKDVLEDLNEIHKLLDQTMGGDLGSPHFGSSPFGGSVVMTMVDLGGPSLQDLFHNSRRDSENSSPQSSPASSGGFFGDFFSPRKPDA